MILLLLSVFLSFAFAQQGPGIELKVSTGSWDNSIRILLLLTVLSLAPSILIMTTAFVRIVIVLSLLRQAIGVPTVPPNQVIVSLAMFLTFFVMKPTWDKINQQALQPLLNKQITDVEFLERTSSIMKEFMLRNTKRETLQAFLKASTVQRGEEVRDVPMHVLIPAFMVSEISVAFQIVFLLYLPFLIVDMVVASILISMGVLMVPPQIISLPFKLMLFVLANGWELVILSLVRSYQ
ncbi:flagellar biosynthetic protein FliP [Thermocrinis albus DSM 14484]|uniref:Flagellar biosynthetic protein FliP n=1 Tax=Thermocrinis albus (strain DSM 14484 / JCM 11386 / HI 11/12) TaxID=638303 RepID=D3SLY2_THEAH|nr:flagellar type III secretion system pore protein FliP [Thermocrinis albus]ADC89762.1 flagellar biosynthetic protein FliP [Thermocrinis albus DSM 14484]